MNPDTATKLAESAYQYGPMFFAVLFLLSVTRWAYKPFKETTSRTQPPPSPKEVATVRQVFFGSFIFGLVLVVVSVVWWIGYRPRIFVFRGEIQDLQEYESLAAEGVYFRTEPKAILDGMSLRNEHFAIIQDSAFKSGQVFNIEFSKNKSKRNKFRVTYDPKDTYPKYAVEWDDNVHTNVLKKEEPPKAAWIVPFSSSVVYAAGPQTVSDAAKGRSAGEGDYVRSLQTLQDTRSDVGSKIVALEQLNSMPATILTAKPTTTSEPPVATLVDLTRHSDKEVSYKAKQVLDQVDYIDYVARGLSSSNQDQIRESEVVFGKLNASDQQQVMNKLTGPAAARMRAKGPSLTSSQQVLATATPQGDRYYVKATWDPNAGKIVECLSILFNRELISNRTLDEERSLMRGRKERVVYWYDKDWSIRMGEKINACGGKASYIQLQASMR